MLIEVALVAIHRESRDRRFFFLIFLDWLVCWNRKEKISFWSFWVCTEPMAMKCGGHIDNASYTNSPHEVEHKNNLCRLVVWGSIEGVYEPSWLKGLWNTLNLKFVWCLDNDISVKEWESWPKVGVDLLAVNLGMVNPISMWGLQIWWDDGAMDIVVDSYLWDKLGPLDSLVETKNKLRNPFSCL